MKCTVCGNENHEGTNYCIHCGSELEAAPAQEMNYYQGYAQQTYPQLQLAMAGATGSGYAQSAYAQPAYATAGVAANVQQYAGGTYGQVAVQMPGRASSASSTSGLAVASLVFGILSVLTSFLLVGLGLINSILAVVFGATGIVSCKRHGKSGKGLAIAGLIMGAFGLIIVISRIAKGVALFNFVKDTGKAVKLW